MTLKAGDKVDRYTLIRPLGEGGQGSVWEAEDPATGKKRALKLGMSRGVDERALQRMRREATMLASIRHPSLVRCYGLFEDLERGVIGLVLDLVEGRTLADAMDDPLFEDRHRRAAFHILAGAVADVHARGLVHRDIKLDNVIVTDDFLRDPSSVEHLKLVDFGIAAMSGNPHQLTSTGSVIGTLAYLAPELVDPATWGRSDEGPRRDLFALGVLGYQLFYPGKHPTGLTGRATIVDYARAYKAASSGVIPWPPPGLDARPGGPIAEAISSCLRLHAENRPADGGAVDQILRGSMPLPKTNTEEVPRGYTAPSSTPKGLTEPMPVERYPPLMVRPEVELRTPQTQRSAPLAQPRSEQGSSCLLACVLVVILLGAGALVLALGWMSLKDVLPYFEPSPITASPAPQPAPLPAPLPGPLPAPQPAPLPAPQPTTLAPAEMLCCEGETSCRSGRPCQPGSCRAVLPERTWSLRLTGVGEKLADGRAVDLGKTSPADQPPYVCIFRTTTDYRCVPMGKPYAVGALPLAFKATTSELMKGNLTLALGDPRTGVYFDQGPSFVDGNLYSTALCRGLLLRFPKQLNGNQRFITLFLDDE